MDLVLLRQRKEISVRSYNVCRRVNIRDLNDLNFFFNQNGSFKGIPNCGERSEKELITLIHKYQNRINGQSISGPEIIKIDRISFNENTRILLDIINIKDDAQLINTYLHNDIFDIKSEDNKNDILLKKEVIEYCCRKINSRKHHEYFKDLFLRKNLALSDKHHVLLIRISEILIKSLSKRNENKLRSITQSVNIFMNLWEIQTNYNVVIESFDEKSQFGCFLREYKNIYHMLYELDNSRM